MLPAAKHVKAASCLATDVCVATSSVPAATMGAGEACCWGSCFVCTVSFVRGGPKDGNNMAKIGELT